MVLMDDKIPHDCNSPSDSQHNNGSDLLTRPLHLCPPGSDIAIKLSSGPTTAVNLETVGNESFNSHNNSSVNLLDQRSDNGLVTTTLNRETGNSSFLQSLDGYSSDENDQDDRNTFDDNYLGEEEDLQHLLNDLMRNHKIQQGPSRELERISPFVGFLNPNQHATVRDISDDEIYSKYIGVGKTLDEKAFHQKLKHFFILSSAGKPIYSTNGTDDIIMGYMGIITTIVSTFEETLNDEIRSVKLGDTTIILVLNRNPIILVSISNISHEVNRENIPGEPNILVNQLHALYGYILAILSKPSIDRSFHRRLNFDLRKVLTPVDFANLDSICMKGTYGLLSEDTLGNDGSLHYFISELLDSSLHSVCTTKTTRTKLNNLLLSTKKLKKPNDLPTGSTSEGFRLPFFGSDSTPLQPQDSFYGEDLLFGLLLSSKQLVSMMRPKKHSLSNSDLNILIGMINYTLDSAPGLPALSNNNEKSEDLWFPLCLPQFNQNGFLYVFVRKFALTDYMVDSNKNIPSMVVALLSGSKNSFFEMQQISSYLISELTKKESFKLKLSRELYAGARLLISRDIKVPMVNHFIYKIKKTNQFVMSDVSEFNTDKRRNIHLQLSYFYSVLKNTRATNVARQDVRLPGEHVSDKKLTYASWDNRVVGIMLSDDMFEFYCLCNVHSSVDSKSLIINGLKIIKWCERNRKRLFMGNSVVF